MRKRNWYTISFLQNCLNGRIFSSLKIFFFQYFHFIFSWGWSSLHLNHYPYTILEKDFFAFSLVFRMVEAEEEYVEQLEILISCFLRPFKMAASSKNPPCSHEDINSIFLNSETVLFLHQIFLKGLTARMDSWPTLVLGTSLGIIFFHQFLRLL